MTDTPLDPDQVTCPRCHAEPGQVCRDPHGKRTRRVHAARRAAAGGKPETPNPGTRESRSKAGKATAARRRKDRATVAAVVGEARARALLARAEELGADAVKWDADRMTLKRLVLDTALGTWSQLGAAVEAYKRVQLGEDDRPLKLPVEVTTMTDDGKGGQVERREIREVLDVRGSYGPDDVKALATAAGIALDKVRLEEGSATSRSEVVGAHEPLTGLSDAELKAFADRSRAAIDELVDPGS